MANFADDSIISTAGGDDNGTFSFPKTGQPPILPGDYLLGVAGTWGSRTISVTIPDRSGNTVIPNDSAGNAMTTLSANFLERISIGSNGVNLAMLGSDTALLTVTLEKCVE